MLDPTEACFSFPLSTPYVTLLMKSPPPINYLHPLFALCDTVRERSKQRPCLNHVDWHGGRNSSEKFLSSILHNKREGGEK
jgi:hypothetical protein